MSDVKLSMIKNKPFFVIILVLTSFLIGIILVFILSEIIFYISHKNWYCKISLGNLNQVSQREVPDIELIERESEKLVSIEIDNDELLETENGYECIKIIPNVGFEPCSISFSCWVKGKEGSFLSIVIEKNKLSKEYFSWYTYHQDEWEYITVVIDKPIYFGDLQKITLKINCELPCLYKKPVLLFSSVRKNPGGTNSANRLYREPINYTKKNKCYRVVCIGGSTTYGIGASDNATYPYILQQKLNAVAPGRFEVINLGKQSGHIRQFLLDSYKSSFEFEPNYIHDAHWLNYNEIKEEHFKNCAKFGWLDLKPDMLIIAPCWNDINNLVMWHGMGSDKEIGLGFTCRNLFTIVEFSNFFQKYALGYYLKELVYIIAQHILDEHIIKSKIMESDEEVNAVINKIEKKKNSPECDKIKHNYEKNLIFLLSLYRDILSNPEILLVTLPGLYGNNELNNTEVKYLANTHNVSYEREMVSYLSTQLAETIERESMENISEKYNIRLINISGKLEKLDMNERMNSLIFCDPIHLTYRGNSLVADMISRECFQNLLVPE